MEGGEDMEDCERAWAALEDAFQSSPAAFEAALSEAAAAEDVTFSSTFPLESFLLEELPPEFFPDLPAAVAAPAPAAAAVAAPAPAAAPAGAAALAAPAAAAALQEESIEEKDEGGGGVIAVGARRPKSGRRSTGGAARMHQRSACDVCYQQKAQCDGNFPCARYVQTQK